MSFAASTTSALVEAVISLPPDVHWTAYPAAFGGFVAASTAVWIALRATRKDRRARPNLGLLYDHDAGQDFATGVMGATQHWVRIRVENAPASRAGRRSADDVEVLIVTAASEDGSMHAQLEGCAFKWSNVHDSDGKPLTRLTIPPGVARRFDLLAVAQPLVRDGAGGFQPSEEDPADGAIAELQVQPVPAHGSSRLAAGRHVLNVVIAARDSDAAFYEIVVDFDGRWWGTERTREHLMVSVSGPNAPPA